MYIEHILLHHFSAFVIVLGDEENLRVLDLTFHPVGDLYPEITAVLQLDGVGFVERSRRFACKRVREGGLVDPRCTVEGGLNQNRAGSDLIVKFMAVDRFPVVIGEVPFARSAFLKVLVDDIREMQRIRIGLICRYPILLPSSTCSAICSVPLASESEEGASAISYLLSSSSAYTCDAGTLVGASFATAISCGTMHSATRQMTQADRMLVVRLP